MGQPGLSLGGDDVLLRVASDLRIPAGTFWLSCVVLSCGVFVSLFSLLGIRRADVPIPAAVFGVILNLVMGCLAFLCWRGS